MLGIIIDRKYSLTYLRNILLDIVQGGQCTDFLSQS